MVSDADHHSFGALAGTTKIEAFGAGADDYVTKPFGIGELLARIRVALRHAVRSRSGGNVLRFENATVDLDKRTAIRDGQPIHLTPIEFRLHRRPGEASSIRS